MNKNKRKTIKKKKIPINKKTVKKKKIPINRKNNKKKKILIRIRIIPLN